MPSVVMHGLHTGVVEDSDSSHALGTAVRRTVGLWVGPRLKSKDVVVYPHSAEYFKEGALDPQTVLVQFPDLIDWPERTLVWRQGLALATAATVVKELFERMPELLWVDAGTHPLPPVVNGRPMGIARLPGPKAPLMDDRRAVVARVDAHRQFARGVLAQLNEGELDVADLQVEVNRWHALCVSLADLMDLLDPRRPATG